MFSRFVSGRSQKKDDTGDDGSAAASQVSRPSLAADAAASSSKTADDQVTPAKVENGALAAELPPSTDAPTEAELDQLAKLGAVLVNLGVTSDEAVFGSSSRRPMNDLVVIHRLQDEALRHPFDWRRPWSWVLSGAQVSPIVWRRYVDVPLPPPSAPAPAAAASADVSVATSTEASPSVVSTETQTIETGERKTVAAAAAAAVVKRKRSGLPNVDMRPLTDAEVAALSENVRVARSKLLKSEESTHEALQGIEDTRYRYLVPSMELQCEAEVMAVLRCYKEKNAEVAAASNAANSTKDSASSSHSKRNPTEPMAPVIASELLACSGVVEQLSKCTRQMAHRYALDGTIAS